MNTLVEIMTSPVAWEMASLKNSNVFNDTQGIVNIDDEYKTRKGTAKILTKTLAILVPMIVVTIIITSSNYLLMIILLLFRF